MQVEAIQLHDLMPGFHKIAYKFFSGIVAGIYFRHGSQFGMGAKDQVNPGSPPFALAGFSVADLEIVFLFIERMPAIAHIQQIHEEIIGELARAVG